MQKVSIEDVESETYDPANRTHELRRLTDPLSASNVAINHYVLEPGERFSGSVHAHANQEEIFLVVEGTATFETREGEISVGENEAIRFGPGEFQSGKNDGTETVVAFALGAPPDGGDVLFDRIPDLDENVACPECGRDSLRASPPDADADFACPDCGAESALE
ncbi:cupin domain-containing protein [Natronoarchaeum rubrum]|uniref:cupin domain-containing protein n=1 Tax=Natronoarchaeum rubrum TaxID=755311 RepID=UPI002111B895|nr:cupin domain-containing protein [Natronoarchaeum rubrum]